MSKVMSGFSVMYSKKTMTDVNLVVNRKLPGEMNYRAIHALQS